jgi:hypothetical protein
MMSSWLLADLTALSAAPPTGGNPSSQVISENGQSLVQVVYTAVDNHLYELRLEPGQSWKATDLTALSGAPDASSNPFAFNFGSLRVYFRAQDFHLHELRLEPRQPWQAADLTALTNTPDAAEGEPFAYNAFPGESMSIEVLYRARDSHLYKLSQGFQQPWSVLDVTASSGALNAAVPPSLLSRTFAVPGRPRGSSTVA